MEYLGVDFGLRRVGLARSSGVLASPWKVLQVKGVKSAADQIEDAVRGEGIGEVVVGVPEGKSGRTAKNLVKILQQRGVKVTEADETLSTRNAKQLMVKFGVSKKKRRTDDAYSAALILQNYLDKTNE